MMKKTEFYFFGSVFRLFYAFAKIKKNSILRKSNEYLITAIQKARISGN